MIALNDWAQQHLDHFWGRDKWAKCCFESRRDSCRLCAWMAFATVPHCGSDHECTHLTCVPTSYSAVPSSPMHCRGGGGGGGGYMPMYTCGGFFLEWWQWMNRFIVEHFSDSRTLFLFYAHCAVLCAFCLSCSKNYCNFVWVFSMSSCISTYFSGRRVSDERGEALWSRRSEGTGWSVLCCQLCGSQWAHSNCDGEYESGVEHADQSWSQSEGYAWTDCLHMPPHSHVRTYVSTLRWTLIQIHLRSNVWVRFTADVGFVVHWRCWHLRCTLWSGGCMTSPSPPPPTSSQMPSMCERLRLTLKD